LSALRVADAAAHEIARLQQLQRDMAAEEAGDTGEQDAVSHVFLRDN
jgi:hypothetical protein